MRHESEKAMETGTHSWLHFEPRMSIENRPPPYTMRLCTPAAADVLSMSTSEFGTLSLNLTTKSPPGAVAITRSMTSFGVLPTKYLRQGKRGGEGER